MFQRLRQHAVKYTPTTMEALVVMNAFIIGLLLGQMFRLQ